MNSVCSGKKGCMAVKLDMSKEYNRVEWMFVSKVMKKMGFDDRWINWVMKCVSTVAHAVVNNGEPSDFFMQERGLRQGDPLSPDLFIICVEVFSHLIQMEVNRKALYGVRVCRNAPEISHPLFADDSISFYRADGKVVEAIGKVLELYGNASGQVVNFNKSEMSTSRNVAHYDRYILASTLGVKLFDSQGKYLGMPGSIGRSKPTCFPH